MRTTLPIFILAMCHIWIFGNTIWAQGLSKQDLRDIDTLAVSLTGQTAELHDEYHHHLERIRHGQKLEMDVSRLEKVAQSLHDFAHDADSSEQSMLRLRRDTNELLQLSSQIFRTIDLAEKWVRTADARRGIAHMRDVSRHVVETAVRIDDFLPVDTELIDAQVVRLENAVKELHKEFHEHLEGYEVSRHLDEDLEDLEASVEHLHQISHGKSWGTINVEHILSDARQIHGSTEHIEELFVQQASIGVRSHDFDGIEHSRDAISDVLASIQLLEHMVDKAQSHQHVAGHSSGSPFRRALHRVSRDRLHETLHREDRVEDGHSQTDRYRNFNRPLRDR